jgi:hypothetical protein
MVRNRRRPHGCRPEAGLLASLRSRLAAGLFAALVAGSALAADPPRPAPAAEDPATTVYVVKAHDTFYALAGRYFVSRPAFEEVRRANHIPNVRRLQIGARIQIPTRLLRSTPIDGVLGAYRGGVDIASGGIPLPLAVGRPIREGMVISTAGDSFARVDLPDGSRVAVPSQSRVRINLLRRILLTGGVERQLTVEAGRSESTVTPMTSPADSYVVRTPVSVSAVRGTDFRVVYSQEDHVASTGVVEGVVAVQAGDGGSALAQAGYGVSIGDGEALAPRPLLPAPKLLRPGRVQDNPRLAFDLEPAPGARSYRAQLATDGGFLDLFTETTAQGVHIEFGALPDGIYFIRLTAVDATGLEGLPATYTVDRALNTLEAGVPQAVGAGRDRRFLFRWAAGGAGQRTYRFQIARDEDMGRPMIDETGLKEPQITVTNMPPGTYHWRVMSGVSNGGRYTEKWSPPQQFTIGGQ